MATRCCNIVLFTSLLLWELAHGMSGAFYADNGLQQSIMYKPLAKTDRYDLQQEILHLLGLEHRPRPTQHDMHSSAPQYLLDLYNVMQAAEEDEEVKSSHRHPHHNNILLNNCSRKAINVSDFIVSFVNRIHHKSPHLRHERDRRFWFDVSEVPADEEIVGAELRIYRDMKNRTFPPRSGVYILTLYSISEANNLEDNMLEKVDELIVTEYDDEWLVFNVTGPVVSWIAFPHKNFGLYLKIRIPGSGRNYEPYELGLIGSKGPEEKQPFMVAFFKEPTIRPVRVTRAAKRRQQDSYYDQETGWNPYANVRDRYSPRNCQRLTLYVSFKDLGWEDWIIAPDGYGAFYCHGECSFPLNAHMNATNHAIVQTLVHLMDPSKAPKPCCAPTQLSAITVLYFDDNSNVVLKKYKNMVVKSCGCH